MNTLKMYLSRFFSTFQITRRLPTPPSFLKRAKKRRTQPLPSLVKRVVTQDRVICHVSFSIDYQTLTFEIGYSRLLPVTP